MKKLIFFLFFVVQFFKVDANAQDYGNKVDPLKLCVAIQSNNFISDAEAENALDRILSVIGASKRFVLQPCDNINNAVAVSYKGVRYILYDKAFMNSLASGNDWGNLFILAHEVGHHVNGHSLDLVLYAAEAVEAETLTSKRQQELEADEFAGFVLGKLGASLSETTSVLNSLSNDRDDTYSTHPSKSKRLLAVNAGHKKSLKNDKTNYLISSNEFFFSGLNKAKVKDYEGAITDFTRAIDFNPNNYKAYTNRGTSKRELNDYQGALADLTKAIELNPNVDTIYLARGSIKNFLRDSNGAIADASKAIELNPNNGRAYFNRGTSKMDLEDYYGATSDFTKAIELNPKYGKAYTNRGASKVLLNDYRGAFADLTKAIELIPNDKYAYLNRAYAKNGLNDKVGACNDARKAQSLGMDESDLKEIIRLTCN
jgi:tetratricopeptide (TPR) repeat protein